MSRPEDIPIFVVKTIERIVDSIAVIVKSVLSTIPITRDLSDEELTALAYALVGDLIASPIPPPIDVPIDTIVSEKISSIVPNYGKYRRMATRIAEAIPILEILPNYTISVISAIRERKLGVYT